MPYETSIWKMVVSGILGVWCHVIIDAIYHWDVQIFWPSKATPLYGLISKQQVETVCVIFFVLAIIMCAIAALSYVKQDKAERNV